ncbi:alpha/beta hydrolase [Novosphingobium sp. G106]|uniref:alpha/beta fold hydrolase n=1 Tax=Novosphingobium sp. G106 TaxID=2849500 RepID=UPI001C2DC3ED|nr:alpha/beta hydrolase [Novosphingobium sp. G106]MBV1689245.1 alpha/beta hydrolase [Novosphingobium sp. G106]
MPRFVTPDGCNLEYRIRGEGPLIVLTPGGRERGEAVAGLADALAEHTCVVTWDRRNAGASDVWFSGESESEIWAQDLAGLIMHLGRGPAWLAGGSAGCRTSVIAALRRPEIARGLLLWSASGGQYASTFLGFSYHAPYIMAALGGGMAAVSQQPFWADRIAENPANCERMLAMDPDAFIAVMKRWMGAFYFRPGSDLTGASNEELRSITLPTLLFEGNDDIHPKAVSDIVAQMIPGTIYLPSPWSDADFMERFTGKTPGSVFDLYPQLAPEILGFIAAN